MKKALSVIAALLLLPLFCTGAARSELALMEEIKSANDFVHCGTVAADRIAVIGAKNLYIWNGDTTEPDIYNGTALQGSPLAAFIRNGELWLLTYDFFSEDKASFAACLKRAYDGTHSVSETVRLDLPFDSLLAGGLPNVFSAVCSGDTLYMLVGASGDEIQLWSTDMNTGETEPLREDGLGHRLFAAPDGRLLVECMDRENGTVHYEIYDPQTKEFTEHGGVFNYDRLMDGLVGAAWDAENDRLYYQKDGVLVCADNTDPENERTVSTVIRPCERLYAEAGLTGKNKYAYITDSGPVVIDLEDSVKRTDVFKAVMNTACEPVIETLSELEARHPNVKTAIDSRYYADAELSQQLITKRDDADIYVVPVQSMFSLSLYFHDYLVGITSPEVTEAVSKMYPTVRGSLEANGKVFAFPVAVSGYTVGVNKDVLERLEGAGAELPADFTGLTAKLEELGERLRESDEYSVFPVWMSNNAIRSHLLYFVLAVYGKTIEENPDAGFDTPELKAALNALMKLDFEKASVAEDPETDGLNFGIESLLTTAPTTCEKYDGTAVPLPLTLSADKTPVLPIEVTVAIINPHSKHKELAQEFMAELTKHTDLATSYTVSDEKNEPVPDQAVLSSLDGYTKQRDKAKERLEQATGTEKENLQLEIDNLNMMIELYETNKWKLDQKGIDRYRSDADKLYVCTYNYPVTGDAAELNMKLLTGVITVDEYTKELDKRTRMLIAEGF